MEPTYLLVRSILKPWLRSWFKWSIEGLENIPREGPAILAFNHIAYLDPFAVGYVVDRAGRIPRFLAKSELFADKRIAWVLRGAHQIEVRRGTPDAPVALDQALEALRGGEIVVIFPEGTVTTDPHLRPMAAKSGAARLALATRAPLIPAALWGTANVWTRGYKKRWRPGQQIAVRIGEPLDISGDPANPADWKRAGVEIMEAIAVLCASLRHAIPDRRRPVSRAA